MPRVWSELHHDQRRYRRAGHRNACRSHERPFGADLGSERCRGVCRRNRCSDPGYGRYYHSPGMAGSQPGAIDYVIVPLFGHGGGRGLRPDREREWVCQWLGGELERDEPDDHICERDAGNGGYQRLGHRHGRDCSRGYNVGRGAPGGGTSGNSGFTINAPSNPVPSITSLSRSSVTAGAGAFTLTVNGSGFVNGSVVKWNGTNRTTTYVSGTQVKAAIAAADITSAGTAKVTVFSPAPGGGTSGNSGFTINAPSNPVPSITSLSPSSVTAGAGAFTLTVNGSGFVNGSVVKWNGTNRTTTYVSGTQVKAAIAAADITSAGTAKVTVFSPAPGGGTSGNSGFTINAPSNPVPSITSLSPSSVTAGAGAFTLTVNGSGFVNGSVVKWNGTNRTTTYVSGTQVKAAIAAADITSAGTAKVTVFSPAPGGGTSGNSGFTINAPSNPVPSITSLSPSSVTAGAGAFT